jgi:penicillin amidase
MSFSVRPVDPAADAALLHGWVSQERARFWGMVGKSLEEVEEIYAWIQDQPHLAAYLVSHDGHPLALLQTYDPAVDDIGRHYDRRPGDVGVHLFLADDPQRAGLTRPMLTWMLAWVLSDERHQRIVAEPDVRNAKSVALFEALGAELGPLVELPDKAARFAFLTWQAVSRAECPPPAR